MPKMYGRTLTLGTLAGQEISVNLGKSTGTLNGEIDKICEINGKINRICKINTILVAS